MKRTEILKDTLSCRIHPQLKEELSSEAYSNSQTTSAYVESILFNRNQIRENNATDYYEKFYLAQEELEILNEQHNEEVGNLNLRLSEADQNTEKFKKQKAHLQEWQNYANGLKEQNGQLENQLNEVTNKLQHLEDEYQLLNQQQQDARTNKNNVDQKSSDDGNWRLIIGIVITVIVAIIGLLVFGKKKAPAPVVPIQNNNNLLRLDILTLNHLSNTKLI